MLAFPYSQHTFDEEMQIAEKMQNIQFVFNGRNLDHFKFVKSHTNRYIQISDVIVGLLGKMFSYFDANSLCDIYIKSMRISKQAKENVRKIAKLIDRSDRKSSLLIKMLIRLMFSKIVKKSWKYWQKVGDLRTSI